MATSVSKKEKKKKNGGVGDWKTYQCGMTSDWGEKWSQLVQTIFWRRLDVNGALEERAANKGWFEVKIKVLFVLGK